MRFPFSMLLPLALSAACSRAPEPAAIRLVDVFQDEMVAGQPAAPPELPPRTEWRFTEASGGDAFTAFDGVSGVAVRDGLLVGRATTEVPILHVERKTALGSRDQLHSIEIRMRASGGANLAVFPMGGETLNRDQAMGMLGALGWEITTPLIPGDEVRTYVLRGPRPVPASGVTRLLLRPTDEKGAEFAIESVRIIFRKEHLAEIESGIGFQGMSEIYRESLIARAPEAIRVPLELPSRPLLDLALGTVDDAPVTFRVAVDDSPILEQTVSTPYRWEERRLDLSRYAGRSVSLSLSLASESEGAIGVWGSPVVRQSGASAGAGKPRNVVVLWADTLRPDHLSAYGSERKTSPNLERMASEGVLFANNISQATWTKVSSPSLLTSLYPSTHGVKNFSDYLPASATTLGEVYRDAGYATVSFASNLFTGQFTNLHQGFEVLHEDGSLAEVGSSKTSRAYVDRLLHFFESHHDVPFFAFVHLYDPHDPFEPRPPYNSLFADLEKKEQHEKDLAKVRTVISEPLARLFGMPSRDELERVGIDAEDYVDFDKGWYDGSIRGMDAEIGRIFERLRELGLDEETLVVFAGDHGEEFLEHGKMFHGQTVYGELTRVPLLMRWPGGIPQGKTVDVTTETIDVMPSVLELSGIAPPEGIQGHSLVPLLRENSGSWQDRPAISEKAKTKSGEAAPWPAETESYSIIEGGYKLVHNRTRNEGTPEFELYDAAKDPFDQVDIASEHQDVVKRLSEALEGWHKMANEAKLAPDSEGTAGLSQKQLERLRSLGYIR
jgi:arylsulfatase A-like enzyme